MNFPHHLAATPVLHCLMGLLLLCLGRKLFWVFVGVIGFFAGVHLGHELASGQPEGVLLLIGVVVGLFGALLAIFLQRIAIAIAGGAAGGLLAIQLADHLGFTDQTMHLVAFLAGAIFAAILISVLFDWALIIISSLTGAVMVSELLAGKAPLELVAFIALAVVGILIQASQLRPRPADRS